MDYAQFKGKPFQVVSKLGVRYTGIFDHINQEDQTICLSQVYNHGTEDRPSARKLPGSTSTLGWVRFHTESIESLALVENYLPPGVEEPADPILASVSKTAPGATSKPAPIPESAPSQSAAPHQAQAGPSGPASLPPKPITSPQSTSVDRVQQSFTDLSVNSHNNQRGGQGYRGYRQPRAQPIEVPDAEFDFSKGTEKLEAEREARKVDHTEGSQVVDDSDEEEDDASASASALKPHPIAIQRNDSQEQGDIGRKAQKVAYNKNSFFDQLSGESSRVSRAEERGRNFDTFGEAGGADQLGGAGRGGYGGGGGGGYRGRGGYNGEGGGRGGYGQQRGGGYSQGEGRGGYGQEQGGGYSQGDGRGGYGRGGYGGGGGGGGGGRGGFEGGRGGYRGGRGGHDGYGGREQGQGQYQGQGQGYRGRGGHPGQNGGGYRGRSGYAQ